MPESNTTLVVYLAAMAVIVVLLVTVVPKLMGARQCPKCFKRIRRGETKCSNCGTPVVR